MYIDEKFYTMSGKFYHDVQLLLRNISSKKNKNKKKMEGSFEI